MLVTAGGPSRRVGANGVLVGREHDCDIVASDPRVSRRHALVRLTADGAEVVPLGRAPIELNGKPTDRPTALAHGDAIALPGLTLSVEITAERAEPGTPPAFRLERARGGAFGITHTPFVVGGGDGDDLVVKGWPEHALVFQLGGGELCVEVATGSATLDGVELEADTLAPLVIGAELGYRDETFIVTKPRSREVTTIGDSHGLPRRITVEVLPRGGRVVFAMPDGDHAVFLADRKLDFVIALLRPPAGHRPGEFIPDDVVRAIVWPRNRSVSRPEINMLISRCRRDLVQAGLAGPRLLERAPGGGGTRFALAADAEVVIVS
jgi:hypothetical protein